MFSTHNSRAPLWATLVVILLSLLPVSSSTAAVVVNPGFEAPSVSYGQTYYAPTSLAGWLIGSGSVDLTPSPPWGWQPAAGSQSLDLSGDNAGSVYQDVATIPGSQYSLRFAWAGNPTVSTDPGCGPADRVKSLQVDWNDTTVADLSFDTTGHDATHVGWVSARLLVAAAGTSSRLRFVSLNSGRCGPILDEVDVATPGSKETATTVTAAPATSVYSMPVTFTAHVIAASAADQPVGSVQFKVDGTTVGTPVALDDHGDALFETSTLPVGSHVVSAVFTSDGAVLDTSDGATRYVVEKASTTTAFGITPNPSVAGEPTTYTATVASPTTSAGTPTGTVQFETQTGVPLVPPKPINSEGQARTEIAGSAMLLPVRASYSGDGHFNASAATSIHEINKAESVTMLTSSVNPVTVGNDFTLSAWVDSKPPSDWWPSGTLTFIVDGDPWDAPVTVEDGEELNLDATALEPGTSTIQVLYAGSPDFRPSSATLDQVIVAQPTPAPSPAQTTPPPMVAPPAAVGGISIKPVSARAFTVKVTPRRDRRRPFRFAVSGRLVLAAGTQTAKGCTGSVVIDARMNRTRVARRATRVLANCRWSTSLTIPRPGRASITATFRGNALVKGFAAHAQTVRAG